MVYGIPMGASASQMTQMYGNSAQTGSVMRSLKAKYVSDNPVNQGPYFVQYPIGVQPLPKQVVKPSLFSRIMSTFLGG